MLKCAACGEEYNSTPKSAYWGVCPTCSKLWDQVAEAGIHQVKAFMVNWHVVYVPLARLVRAGILSKQDAAAFLAKIAPHVDPRYRQRGKGYSLHGTAHWPGYSETVEAMVSAQ